MTGSTKLKFFSKLGLIFISHKKTKLYFQRCYIWYIRNTMKPHEFSVSNETLHKYLFHKVDFTNNEKGKCFIEASESNKHYE